MSYLVLARKWRPKGFDGLVGQGPIAQILMNAISQDRIAHAYIFSGPRGVGKTSTARILAKAMNCKDGPSPSPCGVCESCIAITEGSSVDVIEIDGASNNSVEDIRGLRERVKYAPSSAKYKVYIIDEVHMLSGSAFNALLKTLEEPPSHVIFVLATTELRKIPATILSRCQHMPFRRIPGSQIKARLREISAAEGIDIAPEALSLIARAADGSMRDSLTILDQISSFSSGITEENIKTLLGIADFSMLSRISKAVISGNRAEILDAVNLLSEQGADIRSFARELVQFFRNLLVSSVVRKPEDILDLGDEELTAVSDIVSGSSEDQLTLMLSEIMKAETEVRNSSSPRLALEMALMRASFLSAMKPIKEIIENIDRYGRDFAGRIPDSPAVDTVDTVAVEQPVNIPLETEPVGKGPVEEERPEIENEETAMETDLETEVEGPSDAGTPVENVASGGNDISYFWKKTLEKIDAPLASKISQAEFAFKDDELTLNLNGGQAVFEDSIRKKLESIEQILSEVSGSRIKIKLATSKKKSPRRKALKEKIMNEPLIKETLELFEGRIVDILPIEESANTKNGGNHV
ncbi:MAG: DNA polymerase III subunit gamma/tau [Nitrospirota bacterium]|nr:DNA polymerase III subunit gamma/tau [Nitrospirota bacterium]